MKFCLWSDLRDDGDQCFPDKGQSESLQERTDLCRDLRTEAILCVLRVALREHLVDQLGAAHLHIRIEESDSNRDEADEGALQDWVPFQRGSVSDALG